MVAEGDARRRPRENRPAGLPGPGVLTAPSDWIRGVVDPAPRLGSSCRLARPAQTRRPFAPPTPTRGFRAWCASRKTHLARYCATASFRRHGRGRADRVGLPVEAARCTELIVAEQGSLLLAIAPGDSSHWERSDDCHVAARTPSSRCVARVLSARHSRPVMTHKCHRRSYRRNSSRESNAASESGLSLGRRPHPGMKQPLCQIQHYAAEASLAYTPHRLRSGTQPGMQCQVSLSTR